MKSFSAIILWHRGSEGSQAPENTAIEEHSQMQCYICHARFLEELREEEEKSFICQA